MKHLPKAVLVLAALFASCSTKTGVKKYYGTWQVPHPPLDYYGKPYDRGAIIIDDTNGRYRMRWEKMLYTETYYDYDPELDQLVKDYGTRKETIMYDATQKRYMMVQTGSPSGSYEIVKIK